MPCIISHFSKYNEYITKFYRTDADEARFTIAYPKNLKNKEASSFDEESTQLKRTT